MIAIDRVADLATALAGLRATVADGALIDLAGLDSAIGEAMNAARTALEPERAALRPALLTLMAELDQLSAALARQHHAGAQQRATAAYGATTQSAPSDGQQGQPS
jgi:hypothetical protein